MAETSTQGVADVGTFSHAPLFRGVDGEALERLASGARSLMLRG